MTIGTRIKNRRIELGLSVDEVAEKLGKNRATVYRYEKDDIKDLPITVLQPLADVLQTTPAELMGWVHDTDYLITSKESTFLLEVPNSNISEHSLNRQVIELAYVIKSNEALHRLFDAAKDASFEDLNTIYQMLMALKRKEHQN